jgi:hypothetical protein
MTSIPKVSLEDTLYLVQLARETALAQGRQSQANKLGPVMDEMRGLVSTSHQAQPAAPTSKGMLAQTDFKKLLDVTQSRTNLAQSTSNSASSAMERNRLVSAMSAADMSDLDIARQLGMSREEVRLVLNVQQSNKASGDKLR